MTWIVSLGRQDVDDWEEKSACWLEGNVYLNKKKKVWVCVQEPSRKPYRILKRRTSHTSGIVLHFLFLPGQKNPQGCSWLSGKLTHACCNRFHC